MEDKRIRIYDIAQELGLSTATVSNVLHGKTEKVSKETFRRVQELLEERRYIPSMAGILLAQNSSRIIGVVVNDHEKYEAHTLEDVFIASSLNHLSTEIEKNGQFMMVKKTRETEEILRFASMWNLDGLVLIGFCDQDYSDLRSQMRIPFVVYDGYGNLDKRVCNLSIDNYDGGFQVGTFFRQRGHARALCILDNFSCMDRERWEGFSQGFGKTGASCLQIPMQKTARRNFYLDHLKILCSCSAIFAVSDYYAMELIQFLQKHQIRIPEDISVAGFDDIPMCRLCSPALTSVRQDGALRARIAVKKLQDLREHKETETSVLLPVTLIKRASTR